ADSRVLAVVARRSAALEQLERDLSVELGIVGRVHPTVATLADDREHHEAVDGRAGRERGLVDALLGVDEGPVRAVVSLVGGRSLPRHSIDASSKSMSVLSPSVLTLACL